MHSTIKLTIPEPCSQDWNNMSTTGNGKFCATCNKCVGDYTHFTDQQLIAYFSKTTTPACGRFTAEQLDRVLVVQQQTTHHKFIPQLIFSAALAFGLVNKADAQQATSPTIQIPIEIKLRTEKPLQAAAVNDSNYISGKVIDSLTHKPLAYAGITIIGNGNRIFCKEDGSFKLMVPDNLSGKEITLEITSMGHYERLITLSTNKLPLNMDGGIELSRNIKRSVVELGGVICVQEKKETPWQKFKRKLFHRRRESISN